MTRTAMTRLGDLASTDKGLLLALLNAVPLAHVAMVVDGSPLIIPTAAVCHDEQLLIHGSTGSQWLRRAASGTEVCVTVTSLDGVVVARSGFESSYRYRSAVLFGRFTSVEGPTKQDLLRVVLDRLIPGRAAEVRPATKQETAATLLLAMPLEEWSLKVSDGWPEDGDEDVSSAVWAGVIPMRTHYGVPIPSPDLRPGIPIPASVETMVARDV